MKEVFISKSIDFISGYKNYSPEKIEELQYGLEGIYLTITKSVIILLISFLLGILTETLLIVVFFNILRFTGFGFHAGSSTVCLIFSIILFSILPFCLIYFSLPEWFIWATGIFCLINLIIYAPADTIKRPLPNKRKRKIRKFFTGLFAFIYLIMIICFKNSSITVLLLSALIIETIMVHPFTYKLFRQPYRNYKNYSVV